MKTLTKSTKNVKDSLKAVLQSMVDDFDDELIRLLIAVLDADGLQYLGTIGEDGGRFGYWKVAESYHLANPITDQRWEPVAELFLAGLIVFSIEVDEPPTMRWSLVDRLPPRNIVK
jgi:hypothetical protein